MANPNPRTDQLTPFPPGVSGNPGGRPRKRPQSEANDDLLRMEIPEPWRVAMNSVNMEGRKQNVEILKKGATFADAIAYGLAKKAMIGDATAAKELRESVEGKSVQRVELTTPEDKGFQVNVTFEAPEPARKVDPKIVNKVLEATVIATLPAADEVDNNRRSKHN